MALFGDIGRILGGVAQISAPALGGFQTVGGTAANIIGGLFSAPSSLAPAPQLPMQGPMPQRMLAAPPMRSATGAATSALEVVWDAVRSVGWRGTMGALIAFIRRHPIGMALTFLTGYVTEEVARQAIFEAHTKRRRRMNPANSKALRRAARRIRSFHRLCGQADVLRTRSRRGRPGRCGTCRQNPCRC